MREVTSKIYYSSWTFGKTYGEAAGWIAYQLLVTSKGQLIDGDFSFNYCPM